ncbi:hypothetical protein MD484_g2542, partial [Candolleomyces efflorescens]
MSDKQSSVLEVEKGSVEGTIEKVPEDDGIDPVAEKKLVKNILGCPAADIILTDGFNYVDRTAIGNARVAGLEKDLGMHGTDLNKALTVFYIFYILADIPSNLLLKHVGSTLIAILVVGFGLVSLASAFMTSYAGLIATRVFLGIFEGGTLSGLIYILSRVRDLFCRASLRRKYSPFAQYYRRKELVLRIGLFNGIAPALSGASSGLLRIGDFGYIARWRKIFLIEGVLTVAFGIVLFWIMPNDPTVSKMLNDEERKLAIARIDADQLRTVPPFLAGAGWVALNSYFSYKIRMRCIPLVSSIAIVVVGYIIAVTTRDTQARYAACHLMIMGGCVGGPMLIVWGTDNAAPDTMRAVVSAAICGIGALGSIIAVWTYIPSDGPDYKTGNSIVLAAVTCSCLVAIGLTFYIKWENAKRDRGERDHRLEGKTQEELEQMGYRHPQFRYQI